MSAKTRIRKLKDGTPREYVDYQCGQYNEWTSGRWPERCLPNGLSEIKIIAALKRWFEEVCTPEAIDSYLENLDQPNRGQLQAESEKIRARLLEIDTELSNLASRLAIVPAGAVPAVQDQMGLRVEEASGINERFQEIEAALEQDKNLFRQRDRLLRLATEADELLVNAPSHQVQAELHRLFGRLWVVDGELLPPGSPPPDVPYKPKK